MEVMPRLLRLLSARFSLPMMVNYVTGASPATHRPNSMINRRMANPNCIKDNQSTKKAVVSSLTTAVNHRFFVLFLMLHLLKKYILVGRI